MGNEVFIPITLFAAVAITAILFFYFRYRSRAEYQQTVRSVVDKGQQLTPEFLERLGDSQRFKDPNADLRFGVVGIALGVGIGLFGAILGEEDAIRPFVAIGNIPFLIGVAFVGLWKFSPRH
jgi:hypothetical protein